MKNLVILGAGTAGTMMAAHLNRKLNKKEWKITVIDKHQSHYYQPGFLFIPFGIYEEKDVIKEKSRFIPKGCDFINRDVETIQAEKNQIVLDNGDKLEYNILIIATGTRIVPDEVDGLEEGWQKNIFDFYTVEGSVGLAGALNRFQGGKLAIHIAEMPIKCPVAPLEFAFLADWWLKKRGIRDEVEIHYVTPLPGAFTKPTASRVLGHLLEEKNINLITDFSVERVDAGANQVISFDERKVDYDLLVSIPTNMGDEVMERSGLGDELNYVATDKHTLQSKAHENIFVIGDATDLPSSKAGSVAHFQAEILTHNIMNFIKNKPLKPDFDGHSNCFIVSGDHKGFLIDFNYDVEPVEGLFPFPVVGPLQLLKESRMNYWSKMLFKWIYWNVLLRGLPMPGIPAKMSLAGKKIEK